ncbi:MAG: DUF2806 domain-containing protein [Lachnospiraceae bacterium]|nr:DUF2806 domain-containing protein [Lachnospiraceae bacterium]
MENFNLLPKEAFESMASIVNNLLEKISLATGYIITPKGKKKDMEEAVSFFISEIKNNDSMSDLAKAACISNARRMIREYFNQYDILCIAMDNLDETANPDSINDDWLIDFLEKAGCVNDKDIKLIFGKILADACNNGATKNSKSLMHKLYLMDGEIAKALQRLKRYVVQLEAIDFDGNKVDEDYNILFFNNYSGWDEKYSQEDLELIELEALGIIKNKTYSIGFISEDNSDGPKSIKEIKVFYKDSYISITGDKKGNFDNLSSTILLEAGTVCLTRDGRFLMRIIEDTEYSEEYLDDVKCVFKAMGYKIQ